MVLKSYTIRLDPWHFNVFVREHVFIDGYVVKHFEDDDCYNQFKEKMKEHGFLVRDEELNDMDKAVHLEDCDDPGCLAAEIYDE